MTRRTDIKQKIKLYLRGRGWDIQRYAPLDHRPHQVRQCLYYAGIDLVFDIGANTGEFAEELRDAGWQGEIVSFEPLTQAHGELIASAESDPAWIIHPRCAVGDYDGDVEINIAGNSVSSSVLPMLKTHSDVAGDSAYIGKETVKISRLDVLAPAYLATRPDARYCIKIDTQGFEWQVLDGGAETVKGAQCVLCELSLVGLYEGQRLWRDLIDRLEGEGFTTWSIIRGFTDPRSGRSMQVDGVFLRT